MKYSVTWLSVVEGKEGGEAPITLGHNLKSWVFFMMGLGHSYMCVYWIVEVAIVKQPLSWHRGSRYCGYCFEKTNKRRSSTALISFLFFVSISLNLVGWWVCKWLSKLLVLLPFAITHFLLYLVPWRILVIRISMVIKGKKNLIEFQCHIVKIWPTQLLEEHTSVLVWLEVQISWPTLFFI